jgi:hypothetical protein
MLDELLTRGKAYNWGSLVMIKDNDGKLCNVIHQNRALTMENVIASTTDCLGVQSRKAQDNYLMVQCILNSLDSEGSKALRSSQYSYLHEGNPPQLCLSRYSYSTAKWRLPSKGGNTSFEKSTQKNL